MTKEGKITVYSEGEPVFDATGSSEYCLEMVKGYKTKNMKGDVEYSDAQKAMIKMLGEIETKIITAVTEYKKETGKYPTPIQIKRKIPELEEKDINYITRRINPVSRNPISKILEFEGGEYRGKRIKFKEEFNNQK